MACLPGPRDFLNIITTKYKYLSAVVAWCCCKRLSSYPLKQRILFRKKNVYRSSFSSKFIMIDTLITLLHVSISFESILYVFIPVSLGQTIIICVCNIAIWRNFQRESDASQHRNGASRNRRLSKTLLLVSILALVCWLPLIIMDVLIFLTTTSIPNNFYYMVNILSYSNSFLIRLCMYLEFLSFSKRCVLAARSGDQPLRLQNSKEETERPHIERQR